MGLKEGAWGPPRTEVTAIPSARGADVGFKQEAFGISFVQSCPAAGRQWFFRPTRGDQGAWREAGCRHG